jgi:hypothetical protein
MGFLLTWMRLREAIPQHVQRLGFPSPSCRITDLFTPRWYVPATPREVSLRRDPIVIERLRIIL